MSCLRIYENCALLSGDIMYDMWVFFYQKVTTQIGSKTSLTSMNSYFIYTLDSVVMFLFWKWYTYFKIKIAVLTANIISLSKKTTV